DLDNLRRALQERHAPAEHLLTAAVEILSRTGQLPDYAGQAHFLLGTAHLRLAEHGPAGKVNEQRAKALEHLERAEKLGGPADDRPRLDYRLGKLLYQSGGDLRRAIEYLARVPAAAMDDPADGYDMLAQAYLRLPAPDVEAALQANQKQIEYVDDEAVLGPARVPHR